MDGKEENRAFNLDTLDREDSASPKTASSLRRRTSMYIKRKIKMKKLGGDTIEVPTSCYGDVEFKGATGRSKAKVRYLVTGNKLWLHIQSKEGFLKYHSFYTIDILTMKICMEEKNNDVFSCLYIMQF